MRMNASISSMTKRWKKGSQRVIAEIKRNIFLFSANKRQQQRKIKEQHEQFEGMGRKLNAVKYHKNGKA